MYRVITRNHITATPTVLTGGIIKMKKFGIIIFVLGVGIIFAEIAPETETEKLPPEDSSALEIVTYTSELENDKEANQILKATVQENNEANIRMQELETEKSEEFDKAIENEQAIIDASIGGVENEHFPINFNWDDPSIEDDYVPMQESDFYYKDLMERDPNEIMDTAAGFVPIPILKKRRQKPRRKFANRRYFRRPNPYRRHYYYYPYYGYYYPGSLRFY